MLESEVTQRFIPKLLARGYVVLKLNDRVTVGIPDIFLARGGRAGFLEAKLLRQVKPPVAILGRTIPHATVVQATTATKLNAACGFTKYVLFHGGVSLVAEVSPTVVLSSLRSDLSIPLTWEVTDEWITKLPF